jgi:hypothetical protein
VSDLHVPMLEVPRGMIWENGTDEYDTTVDIGWWQPTTAQHGGRPNAPVVISSNGQMYVFNSRDQYVGAVERPLGGAWGPSALEFWQLRIEQSAELWPFAQMIRPARCVLARVDGTLGVTDGPANDLADRAWRVAYACLLLGYYPPMGLPLGGSPEVFAMGQMTIGDRAARRVKRALLARLALERRLLRDRAEEIETHWR